VHGDQAVDHLALSCQHSLHVGGGGTRHDAKAIGVANEIGNFRAPNLVLAGQAVGVRTGTADQLAFNDGRAVPRFGHVPGQIFAAFATTDDEHFKVFRLGHFQLLVVRDWRHADEQLDPRQLVRRNAVFKAKFLEYELGRPSTFPS
jgi:hypothetical protein